MARELSRVFYIFVRTIFVFYSIFSKPRSRCEMRPFLFYAAIGLFLADFTGFTAKTDQRTICLFKAP